MTARKTKLMSEKEKRHRADIREQLRADGLMRPKKKPLNRKQFITETREDWRNGFNLYFDAIFLETAIPMLINELHPTAEMVGAAKLLKIACELKRHSEACGGRLCIKDVFDIAQPIIDL